jgi:hypothetical protein
MCHHVCWEVILALGLKELFGMSAETCTNYNTPFSWGCSGVKVEIWWFYEFKDISLEILLKTVMLNLKNLGLEDMLFIVIAV